MMRTRLRLIHRQKPLNRLSLRTRFHWSAYVIGILSINLFIVAYLYFNLGTPKQVSAATTMSAVANGNWTATSTWSAGRVPQDGDTLTIPVGKTVTVDVV